MKFGYAPILVVFAILSAAAKADDIFVANFSFEDPTTPLLTTPGQFTTYPGPGNTIPGWNNEPSAGVQYYSTPLNSAGPDYQYTTVRDGVDGAYSDSALISQTLSSPLEAGAYTLTIASGWRGGRNYAGGTFGLYTSDGTQLGSSSFVQPAVQGTFLDTSLTVLVLPTSGELGENLVIKMKGNGLDGGTIDFDDVRLTYLAAPEPSTWLMLFTGGAAMAGLAALRRRAVVCC